MRRRGSVGPSGRGPPRRQSPGIRPGSCQARPAADRRRSPGAGGGVVTLPDCRPRGQGLSKVGGGCPMFGVVGVLARVRRGSAGRMGELVQSRPTPPDRRRPFAAVEHHYHYNHTTTALVTAYNPRKNQDDPPRTPPPFSPAPSQATAPILGPEPTVMARKLQLKTNSNCQQNRHRRFCQLTETEFQLIRISFPSSRISGRKTKKLVNFISIILPPVANYPISLKSRPLASVQKCCGNLRNTYSDTISPRIRSLQMRSTSFDRHIMFSPINLQPNFCT